GCADLGRHDLAFEIEQRIEAKGTDRALWVFRSYHELARWQGPPAALAWVRPRLAGPGSAERTTLITEALRSGRPEVLWVLDPVRSGTPGEREWLVRAAAARRWPDPDGSHEKALAAHYDQALPGDRYRTLGRYLLGLEADSTAALSDSPEHECEVLFYLGLRARAEGRYRDAANDYARCLATQCTRQPAYQSA